MQPVHTRWWAGAGAGAALVLLALISSTSSTIWGLGGNAADVATRKLAPGCGPSGQPLGVLCRRSILGPQGGAAPALRPPVAPKRPHLIKANNDTRVDNYYWLRDDARKSREVISYLEAENNYTDAVMAGTKGLQDRLYRELRGRIKEDDTGVPERDLGYWYFAKVGTGQQYSVHMRVKVPAGAARPNETDAPPPNAVEEVLLDENRRRQELNSTFYMVSTIDVSPDGKLMAWTEDTAGAEKYTLRVKDLKTGREVIDPIPETDGSIAWADNSTTVLYLLTDEANRPSKVMRHKIGAPSSKDVLIYEERDDAFNAGISRSFSQRLLFISLSSKLTSEIQYLRTDDPTGKFTAVMPRVHDLDYVVRHHPGPTPGEDWFLLLVRDKARPNYELLVAPMSDPRKQTVILPHRRDVQIDSVSMSQKHILVTERANASTRLVLYSIDAGGKMPTTRLKDGQPIEFEEEVYTLSGSFTADFDTDVLRLYYESMTTPPRAIDLDIPSGRRAVRKVTPVLGGFSKDDYKTERLWAVAPDGARVPISLVYRRASFKRDGAAPLLLKGYGAYGDSVDPSFSSERLSLLDRGWVVAIAHVRGGGDMGRYWYEDGKYLKKKNTFTDFIACAEHLLKHKYTSSKVLAVEGRSAGGLLIGAVLNMRPDLFQAAIAGVPFVDVVTTMLDDSIPLTTVEFEEWGNPKNASYYSYIKSYAPVDNVRAQRYPNLFVTAGLQDQRVGYWEPAKWVAKLRATKTDSNLLLLKTEMGAGHFSVTGRFDGLNDTVLEYAFLLKATGREGVAPLPGTGGAKAAPAEALPVSALPQQLRRPRRHV